ncbi:cathepsin L1-like isoform X2 [Stegodyphus dumicola]|uniref:cathepsin L1-like isoform X2 n=1 Tax=Stegodyphus dumicola TaxID=202533 RepID=UPI0015A8830F|nr:cathepsin L1-like isoform X2 [Stegodyphus dumicola]
MMIFLATLSMVASITFALELNMDSVWKSYKEKYSKSYNETEEMSRRLIWERNVADIMMHNLQADLGMYKYTQGLNEFSDLDHEEYKNRRLGYKYNKNFQGNASNWIPREMSDDQMPESVDWRERGLVTRVKDQRDCGSCWAFSAVGSLEGQYKRKTGNLVSFSEQNLLDCTRRQGNDGCNGGMMDPCFEYIRQNGGIDTERTYPYIARERRCRFNPSKALAKISSFMHLPSGNEQALKQAVAMIGPISVAIDGGHETFHNYSWGTNWGNKGYIKMVRNKNNQCGIATKASFPRL